MNIGIVFAGGVGKRMHTKDCPKQFLEVCNKPIIIYTLEHFEENPEIDAVVISCVEEWIPYLKELLHRFRIQKVKKIIEGGATGQLSIYNALCAASEITADKDNIVLIHDGVRPLINSVLLSQNIESVRKHGSAITSGIVKETIVTSNEDKKIVNVIPRDACQVAKAPQSFWLSEILEAHKKAIEENRFDFIDSCSMMRYYGRELYMLEGPSENIKITTPEDYYTMRAIIQSREDRKIYGQFSEML